MLTAAAMCMALNVFFEARTEPLLGQLAVMEVTMNRVASDSYPDTICDVVWQKKQFSWTHDGKHDDPTRMSYLDRQAWRDVVVLADNFLNGNTETPSSGATMYHADYTTPYWATSYELVGVVGSHKFYK